jgi:hypothetical protein
MTIDNEPGTGIRALAFQWIHILFGCGKSASPTTN